MNNTLNNKEQKTKKLVKEYAEQFKDEDSSHFHTLRSTLHSKAKASLKKASIFDRIKAGALARPVLSGATIAIVLMVVLPQLSRQNNVYYPEPYAVEKNSIEFDDMGMVANEAALGGSSEPLFRMPSPTQDVTEDEIRDYRDEHGQMLAQDVSINAITTDDDVADEIQGKFLALGGQIERANNSYSGYFSLSGTIPADNLSVFLDEVHEIIDKEQYLRINSSASSQIASIITIDDSIEDLETRIEELEAEIERTTNANKKTQLESQLAGLEYQLETSNESKQKILDEVRYVDVSFSLETIPTVWQAVDRYDVQFTITGFEDPTVMQNVVINILTVITTFILILSYTFWIVIPLIVWWIIGRKKRKLMQQLD